MQDSKRDTDVENRLLDSVGEGEGGMIWENGIETCVLSYVKRITVQVRCMIQYARGWCTWMTQRDGGGRGVQNGEHMFTHGGFMSMYAKPIQYCKVTRLQLK